MGFFAVLLTKRREGVEEQATCFLQYREDWALRFLMLSLEVNLECCEQKSDAQPLNASITGSSYVEATEKRRKL